MDIGEIEKIGVREIPLHTPPVTAPTPQPEKRETAPAPQRETVPA